MSGFVGPPLLPSATLATMKRLIPWILAVLVAALVAGGCSSGPGGMPDAKPPSTLSPPVWAQGQWYPAFTTEIWLAVTADNFVDRKGNVDFKALDYEGVRNEHSSDTEYTFEHHTPERVTTYHIARTEAGIDVQLRYDPPHPTFGAMSAVVTMVRKGE